MPNMQYVVGAHFYGGYCTNFGYKMRSLFENLVSIYLDLDRSSDDLFSEMKNFVAVMFSSIPNFTDFYMQNEAVNGGIYCLELLNEIITAFDVV